MDIIRLIELKAHQLKMYVYDVYRFIDAKIMVEKMEKDIFRDIGAVTDEVREFSQTRGETMDKVNEATTPTQLEQKLTEFEVTLSTDTSEEIEDIRRDMQKLDNMMNRTDPPKYHDEIIEQMEKALDSLENDLQRNIRILNSIVEKLDRQADPVEMAKEIKEFKVNQESQEIRQVQDHVEEAERIFGANSLQRPAGWKKMLSTRVYRTEDSDSTRDDFDDNLDNEMEGDLEGDFEEDGLTDEGDPGMEFDDASDSTEEFDTDFDEEF